MIRRQAHFGELLDIREAGDWRLQFLGESAYLALSIQQPRLAEVLFDGLCVLVPDCPIGPLGLAEIRLDEGRFREAREEATKALRAKYIDRQTMAFAYGLRAKALAGLGRPALARKDNEAAARLDHGVGCRTKE